MNLQEFATMTVATTLLARPVTERDHILGPASAVVTLLEYGDYVCPRCNQARFVVKRLYGAIGDRLRYAFRNFPVSASHPFSHHAAEAAEAAGAQHKFWEMHEILFDHQYALSDKHLKVYGTRVGLDMERFNHDMMLHTYAVRVYQDALSGTRSGVTSTPCFFINDGRHLGRCDFETLLSHIEEVT
jgi:protein-disulfide isomerase